MYCVCFDSAECESCRIALCEVRRIEAMLNCLVIDDIDLEIVSIEFE